MREILSVLFALAIVLALVMITIYGMKHVLKKLGYQGSWSAASGGMEIIACLPLGADKSLIAVKAGEKKLLLGVTAGDIKVLSELSESDVEMMRTQSSQTPSGNFGEILAENFRKKFGAGNNETENGTGNNEKDGKL